MKASRDLNFNNPNEHYVVDIIKSYEYPAEIYEQVLTEDNYLLTLYRIPHGKSCTPGILRPVVVLVHGIVCNSFDFVLAGPDEALAFLLSDRGYDVWMVNCRGSMVSRKHTKLDPDKDAQYWKFSFHEMGIYDLPAIINHIEKITSQRSLVYIGYSMGTLLPYVLLSAKPEYNERFNLVISLSPVAIMSNLRSIPYRALSATRHLWLTAMEKSGKLELFPKWINNLLLFLNKQFGEGSWWYYALCLQALNLLNGKSSQQFEKDALPVLLSYYPDTTSVIVLKHLLQMYRSGLFEQLNHGRRRNMEIYGSWKPPLYNLNNVLCPVVLICSSGDLVAHPKDVNMLYRQLHNCIAIHELEDPVFSHSDFIYGKHAAIHLYPYIFDYMKKYAQVK